MSVLRNVHDPPSSKTVKEYQDALNSTRKKARKSSDAGGGRRASDVGRNYAAINDEFTSLSGGEIADEDVRAANDARTAFHLRLSEIVRYKSKDSAMVIMTLPLPSRSSTSASLYMSWLDFLSKDIESFLFVRGNQESVLTFYS